jgi:hypothetical protein
LLVAAGTRGLAPNVYGGTKASTALASCDCTLHLAKTALKPLAVKTSGHRLLRFRHIDAPSLVDGLQKERRRIARREF